MSEITPRTNTELFGHEDAEALLLRDFAVGTMAHGWIISGPRGIGKATLAYRFARKLLSQGGRDQGSGIRNSDPRPLASDFRIAANSHADLLVVEPVYDEKKEEYAREISVDQAREIARFLSLTPGEGAWRVVIIDSADALNINAANAILKILEEPPSQSVILLVSHNPGKLLPTIRSRCRQLRLKPLNEQQFNSAMQHIAPDIDAEELATLAQLSDYAPGIALDMHKQEAVEIYNQILELLSSLPHLDTLKLHAFADRMMMGQQHANWQLLTQLILFLLESWTKQALSPSPGIAALHPASIWAAKWQQCADQFSLAQARHLDYKQVIITFFHSIAHKEGFRIGGFAA